ncbi:MAG: hypothetical protein CL676_05930 [Bdellovibrionaceae bacterium]|nr:hypothetical protein [Pseudobdellovibrionaceae bacterium]|tara:strand:- start:123 stop:1172 length:1050 start_codon:yes stop_codon:yes gene_type:complete
MRALILCAGEGRRLQPLTHDIAKPAVPVLNVPMWGYPLQLLESLNLTDLHINTHHLPDTVVKSFKRHLHPNYRFHVHHEETLLGSALPLNHFKMDALNSREPFVIANGDGVILTKNPQVLEEMLLFHNERKALATVLCIPHPGAGKDFSGVWHSESGRFLGVGTSAPSENALCLHYASVMICSPDIYSYIHSHSQNIFLDVFAEALQKKEWIQIFKSKDVRFYETGNLKDLAQAQLDLMRVLKDHQSQWNLVDIMDRFQPGWRNYQRNDIFRYEKLDRLRFTNPQHHMCLISPGPQPAQSDEIRFIDVQAPSTFYRWKHPLPDSISGFYMGAIKKVLTSDGQLKDIEGL